MTASSWTILLRQCFSRRLSGMGFRDLVQQMMKRSYLTGKQLIEAILECRSSCIPNDPLISVYIKEAIEIRAAAPSDVLASFLPSANKLDAFDESLRDPDSGAPNDVALVQEMVLVMLSQSPPISDQEIERCLVLAAGWMMLISQWMSSEPDRLANVAALTTLQAMGSLLVLLASTTAGMAALSAPQTSNHRAPNRRRNHSLMPRPKTIVQRALTRSMPFISAVSPDVFNRLDAIQKHFLLFHTPPGKDLGEQTSTQPDVLQFEANIMEPSSVHSKAGIYLYLCASVCKAPTGQSPTLISPKARIKFSSR